MCRAFGEQSNTCRKADESSRVNEDGTQGESLRVYSLAVLKSEESWNLEDSRRDRAPHNKTAQSVARALHTPLAATMTAPTTSTSTATTSASASASPSPSPSPPDMDEEDPLAAYLPELPWEVWALVAAHSGFVGARRLMAGVCKAAREGWGWVGLEVLYLSSGCFVEAPPPRVSILCHVSS